MTPRLEVVCCSAADAADAQTLGVDRIELCSAITLGGLTPSVGTMAVAHEIASLPVMAMVRPRGGGFCYSDVEFRTMERDVDAMRANGADGIVFGILQTDGRIDRERCAKLLKASAGLQTVFHRAFDATPDPLAALEELIDLGFSRVLTSGQAATAVDGASMLKTLREKAAGRIEILGAGTIRPHNVSHVLETSGCDQIHVGAFRERRDMTLLDKGGPGNDPYLALDIETVREILRQIDSFAV